MILLVALDKINSLSTTNFLQNNFNAMSRRPATVVFLTVLFGRQTVE